MKFILNADDFGISEDTYYATIELFERRQLSSATIILSMPYSTKAIEYALKHPEFSFGLHLNFITDDIEKPILNKEKIPSLTTDEGYFQNSQILRKKLLIGKINLNEIALETIAQVNFIKESGLNISHLDSHGHIHKIPSVTKTIASLKSVIGIKRMRYSQNIFVDNLKKKVLRPSFWLTNYFGKNIKKNFITTDFFFNNTNYKNDNWPLMISNLKREGSIEVGIHPGYNEKWRIHENTQRSF